MEREKNTLDKIQVSQPVDDMDLLLPRVCVDLSKNEDERDPLFMQAAEFAIHEGSFTTTDLQRKFWIGYNRVGHLIDQLKAAKVIASNSKRAEHIAIMNIEQLQSLL